MRTIGEGSCGKTVDCGVEFTSRRDLPARFPCGPQKQAVAVPVSRTRPRSNYFRSAEVSSSRCAPDRRIAKRIAHPINPAASNIASPTTTPGNNASAPNESCRNRFSCLNRRYNAGQNDRHPYSRCLGKAEFGTHRKPPGSKPQPGRVATRHLFPAFAKGPSQDSRSFAEVKHAARGHRLRCGDSSRNVAIISSPKRPRCPAG
jgi:hypothetical protein